MFSRITLRTRLFISYLALLLGTLTVLVLFSILFLSSRPAPPNVTWDRLAVILPSLVQSVDISSIRDFQQQDGNRIVTVLTEYSETHNVRTLVVLEREEEGTVVFFDSADVYTSQDVIFLRTANSYDDRRPLFLAGTDLIYGDFKDEDMSEWLFAGYYRELSITRLDLSSITVIIAQPRPTESLGAVIAEYGDAFFRPMLQAALIGILFAFVLAYFISRSLGRPLRLVAIASAEVAAGNYDQQVPEKGPLEMHEVAVAFNRMSAEVRNTQESQREFMANVSHDLKTPLTSIEGFSRAIMDGVAKEPAHAAKIIHEEANRLTRMVTELTDLARLQAGRLSMKMTAIDMGEIVAAIGQRLSVVAARKEIDLQVEAAPMPHIAGDGDRLVQVVTNIISNAIKYTPKGGKVWVKTSVNDGGVLLTAADNGIGIPKESLPHIFDRFYQVDKARGPKRGTGLGLAITREIVEAHGGKIELHSAGENQGTTVRVWLPSPQLSTIIAQRVKM